LLLPNLLQASKNIANFYACWDLMEITTLSNLISLALELSGLHYNAVNANFTETDFNHLIDKIFDQIDMLQKWKKSGNR
jgi:hypothetical protein